jgi:hypothetical protein
VSSAPEYQYSGAIDKRRLGARLFGARQAGHAPIALGFAPHKQRGLHSYPYSLHPANACICREECTTDPAADREPVVSDLACYGQLSPECQFLGCDSMRYRNGLPLALFSWGVAFGLERRRRYAALTSHGISSAARRARASAETRGRGPSGDGRPAPGRDNPHICSGKSRVSGLRAVPLPSSGRTHLPVRLTVVDPRLLTRFCAEMASSAGMPARKSACPPGNKSRPSENDHLQNAAREISAQFAVRR